VTVPQPRRPYADLDDWTLVRAAQSGDSDAYDQLYRRYYEAVYRFSYFRTSDHNLTEDFVSETFLRTLRSIGSFTDRGREFGAVVVTICRNMIADYYRNKQRKAESLSGELFTWDRPDPDRWVDPELATLHTLVSAELVAVVRQLKPDQRQCIELRFFRGYTVAETAHAMGKNENAVKALHLRATRAIGALLPEGFDPDGRTPVPRPRDYHKPKES
jgi:RNA polymerase sigma-70 factor (ECF subfamily)